MAARRLVSFYLFHFRDVADEGSVLHKVVQLLQLTQVLHVFLPDDLVGARDQLLDAVAVTRRAVKVPTNLGDELGQAGVAEQQPASGRDAVGFVLKLLGLQIAEVPEAGGERKVPEESETWGRHPLNPEIPHTHT